MALLTVKNFTFAYAGKPEPVLRDVSFSVNEGDFLLLTGRSGCGKTTLLRQLKPSIAPFGEKKGTLLYDGGPFSEAGKRRLAAEIGFVFQSPEAQIVTDQVSSELCFGLENLGTPPAEIRRRVAEMAEFFGISGWYHRQTDCLSGGQKQLLNLAAVMVMNPRVLILDEPTSQLDPVAAGNFIGMLQKLNQELGQTILLTEHRQEELFPLADRVLLMEEGTIQKEAPPKEMASYLLNSRHPMARALPAPAKIAAALGERESLPLTVKEGRRFLEPYGPGGRPAPKGPGPLSCREKPLSSPEAPFAGGEKPVSGKKELLARAKHVYFRYEKDAPDLLRDLSMEVRGGGLSAILGGNGAGKTTLLKLLGGMLRPYRGKMNREAVKSVYLPQNPRMAFIRQTLGEDLDLLGNAGKNGGESPENLMERYPFFQSLQPLLGQNPLDLSGGELQKAALFKTLLVHPGLILLDEPTKGLDAFAKEELALILDALKNEGKGLVLVTHDVEFAARYADSCAMLFDGGLTAWEQPAVFFSNNQFYTTAACKLSRGVFERAVTCEEVVSLAALSDR